MSYCVLGQKEKKNTRVLREEGEGEGKERKKIKGKREGGQTCRIDSL
jgi:hypothetical protein